MHKPELPATPELALPEAAAHNHDHHEHEAGHPHEHGEESGVLKTTKSCGDKCAQCLKCKKKETKKGEE